MAYTLDKALKKLASEMGTFDEAKDNWRLGDRQFCVHVHSPFTAIPVLNDIFQHKHPHPGNRRTPSVAINFQNVPARMKNQVLAGTIFRMVADLGDDSAVHLVSDIGSEQTNPFTSEYRTQVSELYQQGEYVTFPLRELPNQGHYKMKETAKTVYLQP